MGGATLLSESVPAELRASAQGLSDVIMGLAGATAGALSGVIVGTWSYAMLTVVAGVVTVGMMGMVAVWGRVERQ